MKCNHDALQKQVATRLAPLYLISGDEPFLIASASQTVRQQARSNGFDERIRLIADQHFDWQQLDTLRHENSLFAKRRIFDIHVPDAKFGDNGSKTLLAIATDIQQHPHHAQDQLILITTSKLDTGRQRAKWFKAIENIGVVVIVWPLDAKRFPVWLKQELARHDLRIQADALHYLVNQTEGNLTAAYQDVEKLALLHAPGPLTLPQVQAAVSCSNRYDVFKLIDSCLQGDAKRCLKILKQLRYQGHELLFILWALVRECRLLINCHEQIKEGRQLGEFATKLGIWPQRRALVQQALARLTRPVCYQLLCQAQQADTIIKGLAPGNPWLALQDLSLGLAGIRLQVADDAR
jgi:DNA polymerase III subunit delta